MDLEQLAKRMSAWRAFRGLTLQVVADACGLTKQKISYVEAGDQDIPATKLVLICKTLFKTDMDHFLFGPLPRKAAA